MANKITVKIPEITIGKPDIYIQVKNARGILGTLTISKSFIEWKPKNKKYGKRNMNWRTFDKIMENYSNK